MPSLPTHHRVLKLPALSLHKLFKRQTRHVKMPTDIRNLCGVRFEKLHGNDGAIFDGRSRNDERIGISSTLQKLLLFEVSVEVLHAINSCNERALRGGGCGEQGMILLTPRAQFRILSYPTLSQRFSTAVDGTLVGQ